MSDKHTKEIRSMNMSRIHSKDTRPEEIVRKYLFGKGLRYRKNVRSLPGCPDIVLSKYRVVVFVNGCFWHHHNCDSFVWPKSNAEYWKRKIDRNVERDKTEVEALIQQGWRVLTIWECQLKKDARDRALSDLFAEIVTAKRNRDTPTFCVNLH